MCGIFGTMNFLISYDEFKFHLNKIEHRGPDSFGIWENDDSSVKLGHRRLSIIDTDKRSDQPMSFDDRYYIVFNGEIYNYIELRDYLKKKGISFLTNSDTEVLLKLFIEEGPESLYKLNGMWSFAIYDSIKKELFLCRDELGKKPLYYIHDDERFVFASEMKSLYGFLEEFSYNSNFIKHALENPFGYENQSDTQINNISRFPAGTYGIFTASKLTFQRYFFPEILLHQNNSSKFFEDAVEEFREIFDSACHLRTRSDVPIGSALSGGIDSGYIVSTLGLNGSFKEKGYTAIVSNIPGSMLDETENAVRVANFAGVEIKKVRINTDLDPNKLFKSIYDFEDISVTSPSMFYDTYKSFRDLGIVVTLDGHGCDELFGGYPFDLLAKVDDDFPNIYKIRSTMQMINQMNGIDKMPTCKDAWGQFKNIYVRKKKSTGFSSLLTKTEQYKNKLFNSVFSGILPTLLKNYDHYSMHSGVEIRMPFLDMRLVKFAFSLPDSFKIRNNYTKAIVREAANTIMPHDIVWNRRKIGWNSPLNELLSGPWKEWLLDEINSIAYQNCELINKEYIDSLIIQFFNNESNDLGAAQILWLHLQPFLIEKANNLHMERFVKA
jgi:asparagine synthase (glutamine-hydrolysing)